MAPSVWGVSLLLLLQGFLIRNTLATRAIHVEFGKPLADNSTDDFLFPLAIGENDAKQTVYLAPSTNNAHTFAISPKACTPPGNDTAWTGCVKYRGGVFDPTKSSFQPGSGDSTKLDWKNDQYTLFADGVYGQGTITLSDKAGDVQLKDFEVGLVDACNMTSGFLGLGPNSTLLERLYKDGKIESRSYGLHVGIDITNYPYPVFDPTFDTGEKPKEESDYNSGIGKRSRITERAEEVKPKEVHSFTGGLTLGGYDKSRIDNRTASLTAPLSADGLLELELTELILINSWMQNDSPIHDLLNETRKVIIDSSTPYMYLPDKTADLLSYSMEAYYGDPMVDFFYGSNPDKYLGNVTFTLQAPGGSESIKIVVPPSVFQQPIGMLRDYQPVGDGYYDYYMPIKQFKASSKQPIILGRSFLKAAYIFVNHERKNFHISQVAYTGASHDIISISASDSGDYGSGSGSSGTSSSQNPSPGTETRSPPVAVIAGASAGGAFLIALIAFLIWRRRNKPKQTHLHSIPSNPSFHENELEGSHALVQLPANSIEKPPVAASSPYPNDTKTGWNTQPQQGHHEMGNDVGIAVSPYSAYGYPQQSVPGYAELATPPPTQQQYQAGSVQGRYEMM